MVFVGEKKYACETCIKGHRSSSCKHTDRPLFEIKKKGRPVTQCEHCRELRKTRQIHVKCVCENKDDGSGTAGTSIGSSGQGGAKVPARAAFPSGLPEQLLEASVASRPLSEGSDSDKAGRNCCCKDDASCTCWTPRSQAKRAVRPTERRGSQSRPSPSSSGELLSQPAALVVHAHSGNNRPVLPKPPTERPVSPSRASHIPNTSAPVRGRSPSHGQSFYSPYGRAYEQAHAVEATYTQTQSSSPYHAVSPGYLSPPIGFQPDIDPSREPGDAYGGWQGDNVVSMFGAPANSPSLCNCGSSCACPGCVEHNGPNVDPSASCANPTSCSACLECNILAFTSLPGEMTQPMYEATQTQNVDEWLRQVSMPDFASSSMTTGSAISPTSQTQPDVRFDPSAAQYRMWNDPRVAPTMPPFSPAMESQCCGGRCKCPAGMCACPPDCCGCCQGCTCVGCDHEAGSERTLTFATSGERAPCCGGRSHSGDRPSASGPSSPPPVTHSNTGLSNPSINSSRFVEGPWPSQLLTVPRETLSRASSHSSKSSPHPSTSSSSPGPYAGSGEALQNSGVRDMPTVQSCCSSMGNLTTQPSGPNQGGSQRSSNPDHHAPPTRTRRYS
ncbi:hypothetical protein OH77DRAFT_1312084 [Trametes cingulata]|nr:hypothetical protein OH77DRAFT_1312084 [Trametes cingulata]